MPPEGAGVAKKGSRRAQHFLQMEIEIPRETRLASVISRTGGVASEQQPFTNNYLKAAGSETRPFVKYKAAIAVSCEFA